MTSAVATIARRPLTAACWRETLYLLLGFVMATAAFTLAVTGVAVSLSLLILIVGIPVAVGFVFANRVLCDVDRHLAALVRGRAVERPYRPAGPGSLLRRAFAVLGARTTWRDLGWMLLSFPVAIATFTVAVTAWSSALALLSLPIWWQFGDTDSGFLTDLLGDGSFAWRQLLAIPVGLLAAVAAAWLVRGCALAQSALAAALLGRGREEALAARVATLTETRAGAVDAAVSELERVERDLHDGAQARLAALNIDLGLAEQKLAAGEDAAAAVHVADARRQATQAMGDLRGLVRGIGPSILRDRGLEAALRSVAIGTRPPVDVTVDLPGGPPDATQTALYFVCVEAIANATKHAEATHIDVRVGRDHAGRLVAEITDDGRGGADPAAGSGLAGLRKRVAAIDGTLEVRSPDGGPTIVRAVV